MNELWMINWMRNIKFQLSLSCKQKLALDIDVEYVFEITMVIHKRAWEVLQHRHIWNGFGWEKQKHKRYRDHPLEYHRLCPALRTIIFIRNLSGNKRGEIKPFVVDVQPYRKQRNSDI